MTRNGIEYNLKKSPYLIAPYRVYDIVYYFSSFNHREKFIECLELNRSRVENSLSKRFGFSVKFIMLSDINLYAKIENRGFRITIDGKEISCLEEVVLGGGRVTKKI